MFIDAATNTGADTYFCQAYLNTNQQPEADTGYGTGHNPTTFWTSEASCHETCANPEHNPPGYNSENVQYENRCVLVEQGEHGNFVMNFNEFTRIFGEDSIPTIDIWTLSYNSNKELVQLKSDHLLSRNLKNYIDNFRLISDTVQIRQGFIVNFGVYFDVVAHLHAIKSEVKLRCIQKIIEYFDIGKMQFMQPIYVSQLEYELMNIDGVRAVNETRVTQGTDFPEDPSDPTNYLKLFGRKLYTYSIGSGESWDEGDTGTGVGYGYKYDFEGALSNGIIRPAKDPAVFELKNPKRNVVGVVK